MKWKTIGQIAKWTAIAVVPGAAGYVAYRYVVRPWLDNRAEKKRAAVAAPVNKVALEESQTKSDAK